ncbi:hypothetical protein BD408DRAFT_347387 [Parasitella parasitica]|nr:hypothetical protein BD408DRAFT_347387 [Parasitella parasitica]
MPYNNFEEIPNVLYQLSKLKELDLSHNQIKGHVCFERSTIEQLDLSYNQVESIDIQDSASNIVKLNLSNNQIAQLPSASIWTRLKELIVNQNKLKTLFPAVDKEISFPSLVRLEAGNNLIAMFDRSVSMPKLVELSLTSNKLQDDGLIGLAGAPLIQTLDISSNQLQNIPAVVTNLTGLQRLDVRGNQLLTLPYELGKLGSLKMIHCTGNPMRSFASMSQTQLIESLKSNYSQQQEQRQKQEEQQMQSSSEDTDAHTTFNEECEITSLSNSLAQNVSLTKRLDLSRNQLSELPRELMVFSDDIPGVVLLDHNKFAIFPANLTLMSNFIVKLHLEHNILKDFNLTMKNVVFTNLKVLNLSKNRLQALECIQGMAPSFPKVEELILDHNSLRELPETLPAALPSLKSLSVYSNKLDHITEKSFGQSLEVLILSNNDIGYLPPGLSALKNLKELVVFGNRFRVPRPAVVEQGTRAILEFLSHRHNNSS